MKISTKTVIFLVAAVLLISSASADFTPSKWQYKKAIIPPAEINQKTFVEVTLDNEIFSNANKTLSDIRIVSNSGIESPYILVTEAPETKRESFGAAIFNKGVSGETTTFSVDLGKSGIIHNKVTIITNSQNFRREIKVEGSDNQVGWITFADTDKKYIYDYNLEFSAQDTSITYPESTHRYLRVTITDGGETPISILSVRVEKEVADSGKEVNYEGQILEQIQNTDTRTSSITLDIGAQGVPTSELRFTTSAANFNRAIALEGSNDKTNWQTVTYRDVIFSYQTPKFTGSKLNINYPERNYRYFRLTIFNKDDQPITINSVNASGFLRKLVFEYDPSSSYELYYGNSTARFAEYDLKNYISYFDTASRKTATLGAQSENESFEPIKPPQKPLTERYPSLLIGVLILAVAIVGLLTFRLFKNTIRK